MSIIILVRGVTRGLILVGAAFAAIMLLRDGSISCVDSIYYDDRRTFARVRLSKSKQMNERLIAGRGKEVSNVCKWILVAAIIVRGV